MSDFKKFYNHISETYTTPNKGGYISITDDPNSEIQYVMKEYNLPKCIFTGLAGKQFVQSHSIDENGNIEISFISGHFKRQNRMIDFETFHNNYNISRNGNDYTISRTSYTNSELKNGATQIGAYESLINVHDWGTNSEMKILNHREVVGKLNHKYSAINSKGIPNSFDEIQHHLSLNANKYQCHSCKYNDHNGYISFNESNNNDNTSGALVPSEEIYRRTQKEVSLDTTFKELIDFSLTGFKFNEKSNEIR